MGVYVYRLDVSVRVERREKETKAEERKAEEGGAGRSEERGARRQEN